MRRHVTAAVVLAIGAGVNAFAQTASAACQQLICEYAIPTPDSMPGTIIPGPDGAMWFTENSGNKISRITLEGEITEFAVPIPDGSPTTITFGPDGTLWFGHTAGKIGRMTTDGQLTDEFTIPTDGVTLPGASGMTPGGPPLPTSITIGPDGAFWFVTNGPNRIGRMTSAGEFTMFTVPTPGATPHYIVPGPDGALWFTEFVASKIGRITTAGAFTEFTIPTPASVPGTLTVGPDGAIWFGEGAGNKIGRLTMDGQITEFPVPTTPGAPATILPGPDGALWFLEHLGNKVARITLQGFFTEWPIPTPDSQPQGMAFAPDGSLWFTEKAGNKVGVMPSSPPLSQLSIEWVPVWDPGNPPDDEVMAADQTTGYGSVPYEYSISKYLITNEQYVEFLNAVASESDPYGLYFICMDTSQCGSLLSPSHGVGSGIVRTGIEGNYSYAVEPGREQLPVNYVNWYGQIRFANWLNNGKGDADTETGAYTLLGGTAVPANAFTVARNSGARITLPTDHEWYKAAYWDPVAQVYYDYPAGTDDVMLCDLPTSTPNRANCELITGETNPDNPGLTGVASWYFTYITEVGAYTNSASPFGAFDMGGNLFQWTEDLTYAAVNQYHAGSRLSPLYDVLSTITDPGSPWETGFGPCAILRGTDFGDGGEFNHANGRTCDYTVDYFETYGIRLVQHDNCALVENPLQEDRGGIDSDVSDGIGDACQCGDVTGNGIVNGQDANAIKRHGLSLEPNPTFRVPGNCDVTGNGACNGQDANAVKRAALGSQPNPAFGQNCHNAIGAPVPPGL